MKSEEQKYLDALFKAHELKKAWDDLKPESRQKLFQELLGVATIQEAMHKFQIMMQNNCMR